MSIVGVILAGGKSTRMRQDKALLKLNGISLLQRQFQMLEKQLGEGKVLVSGDRPEFPHIKDIDSGLGPLEGLRSVCSYLLKVGEPNAIFVVPIDMPFISFGGFDRLVGCRTNRDVTKFKGQQLPIVIYEIKKVFDIIETLKKNSEPFSEGHYSFTNLFKEILTEEIPAEPDIFFANINTPEDWNAALSKTIYS